MSTRQLGPFETRISFNRPQPAPAPPESAPAVLVERYEVGADGNTEIGLEYSPGQRANVLIPDGQSSPETVADLQRLIASEAVRWRNA